MQAEVKTRAGLFLVGANERHIVPGVVRLALRVGAGESVVYISPYEAAQIALKLAAASREAESAKLAEEAGT